MFNSMMKKVFPLLSLIMLSTPCYAEKQSFQDFDEIYEALIGGAQICGDKEPFCGPQTLLCRSAGKVFAVPSPEIDPDYSYYYTYPCDYENSDGSLNTDFDPGAGPNNYV